MATFVGIATWLHLYEVGSVACSIDHVVRGANIGHGLSVAVAAGLLVSILIPLVRSSPSALAAALVLGVLTLAGAILFVGADAATWQATQGCVSLFGPTPDIPVTDHVYYLYILWGVPLLLLAWEAAVCLDTARHSSANDELHDEIGNGTSQDETT